MTYDGPDLAEVARLTGLDEDEVVAAHTGTPWRVAFGGFAPGFAYLTGGDERLRVPRRDEPRTTVPAARSGWPGSSAASTRGRRRVGGSSSARPTPRCGTRTATRPHCFFRAAGCGSGRRHDRRRRLDPRASGLFAEAIDLRRSNGLCEVMGERVLLRRSVTGEGGGEPRPRGRRGGRDRPRAGSRAAGARGVGRRAVRGGGPGVADPGEPAGRQRGGRRGRRGGPRRARRPGDLAADGRPGRCGGAGVGGRHAGRPPRRRRPAARAGAAARDAADRPAHLPRGARRDRRRAGAGVAQHGHAVRARAASATDRATFCPSGRSPPSCRSSTSPRCARRRATRSCCAPSSARAPSSSPIRRS